VPQKIRPPAAQAVGKGEKVR